MLGAFCPPIRRSPTPAMVGLNAPYGARCFLTQDQQRTETAVYQSLNAPYGARCFLTRGSGRSGRARSRLGLNAPYGARCFLTRVLRHTARQSPPRLNAPYGARCFLTSDEEFEEFMRIVES